MNRRMRENINCHSIAIDKMTAPLIAEDIMKIRLHREDFV